MTNGEYMELKKRKLLDFLVAHFWLVVTVYVLGMVGIILCSVLIEELLAIFLLPYVVVFLYPTYRLYEKWLDLPRKE